MKLEGKVALVTGAGGGVGQAIAFALGREGAAVVVNDIDAPSVEATCHRIRRMGGLSLGITCDAADAGEVGAMVSRTIDELGRIDILVNNAGTHESGTLIEEETAERWDKTIASNLRSTYLVTRRVGRWMASHGGGKIVNVASIAGIMGAPEMPGYGAAKAAIIHLTRSLAADWGKYKINVNCVAPGAIDTPLSKQAIRAWSSPEELLLRIPLGRLGEPDDVANAVVFLASDAASYITGVVLPVDGGRSA